MGRGGRDSRGGDERGRRGEHTLHSEEVGDVISIEGGIQMEEVDAGGYRVHAEVL